MDCKTISTLCVLSIVAAATPYTFSPIPMKCSYGERGSLTATCSNATASFFRITSYRFDHLDETVRCVNCNLDVITPNTFDISGNQIITLDLQQSKIKNLSPSSFVGLVYMENLLLSDNEIKAIIPGTFKGVKKVKYLNMSNNSISMLVSDGFSELSNLTRLFLNGNAIRSIEANAFSGLSELNELNLEHNLVVDLKDAFLGLGSLLTLNLAHNEITQISPNLLNLTALKILNLGQNKLRTLHQDIFFQLHKLETLNLSSNQIDAIEPGAFRGLKVLEYLDLGNNSLSDLEMSVFIRLYNLREIDLPYNKFAVLKTSLFTPLPELRYLNVSHNSLTTIQRTGLMRLHNLHSLDLSYNNLTYMDYKSLIAHAPKLVFIGMENNSWPCYLLEEMLEYFKEDNMEFTIDDKYERLARTCNHSKERPDEIAAQIAKFEAVMEPQESTGGFYVIYSLIFIIIGLIALLFYLQYRTYAYLKNPGERDLAEVHLITSSGLENREQDY